MPADSIILAEATADDLPAFKRELQDAFAVAVIAEFGPLRNGPIPADQDLDGAIAAPGAVALRILRDGRKVGGAVLTIDRRTHRNTLDLFFLKLGEHGHGLGLRAWQAIERRYPETVSWQTLTPYFEKRNIHFYVNKCGFRIVEFFNDHHPEPQGGGPDDLPSRDSFRFEKIMPRRGEGSAS